MNEEKEKEKYDSETASEAAVDKGSADNTNNKKDVFVFLMRAYNDIDHMTPIIDRLVSDNPDIKPFCIICDTTAEYNDDFRIQHLKSRGVSVYHILHFIGMKEGTRQTYFTVKDFSQRKELPKWQRLMPLISANYMSGRIAKNLGNLKAANVFDAIEKGVGNIKSLFIDHTRNAFYDKFLNEARARGVFTAALPHAVDNWDNELIDIAQIDPSTETADAEAKKFNCDKVIVPNKQHAERCIARGQVTEEQIKVLGSPRFCDEWIKKIRHITPDVSEEYLPQSEEGKLKIVIMMTKPHHNIFEDEVIRIISFISKIPDVQVVAKLHTRGMQLPDDFPEDIECIGNEVPSTNLIDWADLTLFSATSIVFDNLKCDKPVLYLRRTVANKLVFEKYIESWNIDTRDDLRDTIIALRDGKLKRTYTELERDDCLKNLIDPNGKDVLGDYVKYLSEQGKA